MRLCSAWKVYSFDLINPLVSLDSIDNVKIQSGDILLQYLYRIICYSKLICKNMAIKLLGAGAVTVCVQSVRTMCASKRSRL